MKMKELFRLGLVAAFCGSALAVSAAEPETHDGMAPMHTMKMKPMNMKDMDLNGDGLISKDEFMKHHEAMWGHVKKDSNGNVSLAEMQAMHDARMMEQ